MVKLPIYVGHPTYGVEVEEPCEPSKECKDCVFHSKAPRVCTSPIKYGEPGGLLVLGGVITKNASERGVPFTGPIYQRVKTYLSSIYKGPITYDNCVKCPLPPYGTFKTTTGKTVKGANFNKRVYSESEPCKKYVTNTMLETEPTKIIVLGKYAANSILETPLEPLSNRRMFRFLSDGTPVFILPDLLELEGNRLLEKQFMKDLLWAIKTDPEVVHEDETYSIINNEDDMEVAFADLFESEFVYDVETSGPLYNAEYFEIICAAFSSTKGKHTYVVSEEGLNNTVVASQLKTLLEDLVGGKIGSNVTYDNKSARFDSRIKAIVRNVSHDTMLMNKNLDTESDCHLEMMAETVGMGGHKKEFKTAQAEVHKLMSSVKRKYTRLKTAEDKQAYVDSLPKYLRGFILVGGKPEVWSFAGVDKEILHKYCALDVVSTKYVTARHRKYLEQLPHLQLVWDEILKKAIPMVDSVCANGMYVHLPQLSLVQKQLEGKLEELLQSIQKQGVENPASTQQVAKKLFGKKSDGGLGLPVHAKTEGGSPSCNAEALSSIKNPPQLVEDLREYSKCRKILSAYALNLPRFVGADGRVHGTLKIGGTTTGRAAMSEPNLQNIPRGKGSVYGALIKKCFQTQKNRLFTELDYSQIELRIAAFLSGDKNLIQVFKDGVDPHLRTAKAIAEFAFGMHPDDVLPGSEQRSLSKAITFGYIYGQSAGAVAEMYSVEESLVKKISDAVFGVYKDLVKYATQEKKNALMTGYGHTYWGGKKARQRNLIRIGYNGRNVKLKQTASSNERAAFNTPCQGTASDICLVSAAHLETYLYENNITDEAIIMGLVHDAILSECTEDYLWEYVRIKKNIMCDHDLGEVPLAVDAEVGYTWAGLDSYVYKAPQEDAEFDKRFSETVPVDQEKGISKVLVRKEKGSEPWVSSYEFDPTILDFNQCKQWLTENNLREKDLHKPWKTSSAS